MEVTHAVQKQPGACNLEVFCNVRMWSLYLPHLTAMLFESARVFDGGPQVSNVIGNA